MSIIGLSVLHSAQRAPYSFRIFAGFTMSDTPRTISDLTVAELNSLVQAMVDDRLRLLIGDPDLGAPLSEAIRERLKRSLSQTTRMTGEDLAEKLGLRW
jgi:hypothetical protein